MGILIVHPDTKEKLTALKAFMKALQIQFEEEKSPYDPEFVKEILQAKKDISEGKGVAVKTKDLWK